MALEICEDCGKPFETKYGFICQLCRQKRLSYYAKKRNLNKLGNEAYSGQCAERKNNEQTN